MVGRISFRGIRKGEKEPAVEERGEQI